MSLMFDLCDIEYEQRDDNDLMKIEMVYCHTRASEGKIVVR